MDQKNYFLLLGEYLLTVKHCIFSDVLLNRVMELKSCSYSQINLDFSLIKILLLQAISTESWRRRLYR